jgi:hypothetical protein
MLVNIFLTNLHLKTNVYSLCLKEHSEPLLFMRLEPIAMCEYLHALCYVDPSFEPCSDASACFHESLTSSSWCKL